MYCIRFPSALQLTNLTVRGHFLCRPCHTILKESGFYHKNSLVSPAAHRCRFCWEIQLAAEIYPPPLVKNRTKCYTALKGFLAKSTTPSGGPGFAAGPENLELCILRRML
jgi:hypothetical protein